MPIVPPTTSRLIVKRGGHAITGKIPKPFVIIDSREQQPFNLARFGIWRRPGLAVCFRKAIFRVINGVLFIKHAFENCL